MREYSKSKTAAKIITYESTSLKKVVLDTVAKASALVGSTLGPNGKVVLIERQENLPPFTSKDGITVFKSMAFANSTAQAVLEAARDSSSKTNVEAGDGTTSATILAEALIRLGFEYLEKNPHLSTQKVMRELENAYKNEIVPFIKGNSLKITNDNDSDLLRKVSMIATNHDEEMTDSVIEAFDLVGHNGQITISEVPGGMGYGVEKIEGFPIARGFEDSCGRFIEEFINDKSNYRTVLEKPHFLLYNGKITEPNALIPILQQLENAVNLVENPYSPNLVIVAHHFSDTVLAFFAQNFKNPSSFNILPLKTPMTQQANSQYHFLQDLAAFTGSAVLDPLNKNLESAELEDLGKTMSTFEYYRYKSILLGDPDEFLIISRSKELEQQAKHAESDLDAELLKERAAILTGGIARIKVFGSSESELKEKAHRVEDAVMAIKGALREGVLPGCGKTLLTLSIKFSQSDKESLREIMAKAFMAPFVRIFVNGGYNPKEIQDLHKEVVSNQDFWYTYDALNHKYGNAIELGIVDSASAVLMSVKNSLSVAKMLMGLSGIVVFKRDNDLDAEESKSYSSEQEAMKQALADSDKQKFEPEF